VIKIMDAKVGQFLWIKSAWEPDHCRARRSIQHRWNCRGGFPSKFIQLHQQRWAILRVESLALWKIMNGEDVVLFPKIKARNFHRIFTVGIFFGWQWAGRDELLCRHSVSQGIIWIARNEIIPKGAKTTGTVDVYVPLSGISGPTFRRVSSCPNLHEWWTQTAQMGAQLLSYWFSRNPAGGLPRLAREFDQ
jgi:hypothetical protein